ncbi:MAG: hypothetical protein K6F94_06540 [Bacteroidaceae bacterium]|nr:hypothetical protein [Bacteroidaceae bacterium]
MKVGAKPLKSSLARASAANSDGGYAAEGQQRQQGARASTAAEGVDLAAVNADGITAIIQKRIDAHLLSSEDLQAFTDWQTRHNNAAEALRRLEAG